MRSESFPYAIESIKIVKIQTASPDSCTSVLPIRPVLFGDYTMIPGSVPKIFVSGDIASQGILDYPTVCETTTNTTSNWAGNGTVYCAATYSFVDKAGNIHESAPSPSIGMTANTALYMPYVNVIAPCQSSTWCGSSGLLINLYTTSLNGNDFFLSDTQAVDNAVADQYLLSPTPSSGSASSGLSTALTSTALYTQNGELENISPVAHYACCIHADRYFYGGSFGIRYSKSYRQGIGPEFNDILSVECGGRNISALASKYDKLFAFTSGEVYAAYGQPLNDFGSGEGLSPLRPVSNVVGVAGQTCLVESPMGVTFIGSDRIIHNIGPDESVADIGVPVRYWTETYTYKNCYVSPVDHCIRFTSVDVGAPTLSFDYIEGSWSTFTGRYDDGVLQAISCNLGQGNVDVVMTIGPQTTGNQSTVYLYSQDTNNGVAVNESFNVNISTSWISLGDLAGYGKFYKWTLVGGKRKSALNLNLKTAYDYEPYWTDSQDFSANSLNAFSVTNQYGTMASNTVVDQALKLDVNGSRHKTDAIRLCISENNGTARDSIEILGARLEIGVRPGSTRLGSGRTVS
jgi:hypothetical protein